MALYGLPASPLQKGTYRGKPYWPAGLTDGQLSHLDAFLARAEGKPSCSDRVQFIEGKGAASETGDGAGREAFCAWFKSAKIQAKINDTWDIVLGEHDMDPQSSIKDRVLALKANVTPEFTSQMPKIAPAKAECHRSSRLSSERRRGLRGGCAAIRWNAQVESGFISGR